MTVVCVLVKLCYDGRVPCGKRVMAVEFTSVSWRSSSLPLTNGSRDWCVEREDLTPLSVPAVVYSVAVFLLSSLFLFATLLVFATVPETRTPKSSILICHVASLFVAYALQLEFRLYWPLREGWCFAYGYLLQYCYLAASFWINVLCWDMACVFSSLRIHRERRSRRWFLLYSLYAWGAPGVISAVTAIMQFTKGIPDWLIKPHFSSCWINESSAGWAYFYGPTTALCALNSLLLALSVIRIVAAQCSTRVLTSSESRTHLAGACWKNDKMRLLLYWNLFFLMGPPRLLKYLGWAIKYDCYEYVNNMIDLLRAAFVFVFVCCKPRIVRRLRAACARPFAAQHESTPPCTTSSTLYVTHL